MKRYCFICLVLLFPFHRIFSQQRIISADVEASAGYISSGNIPFWLRSNQYGSIPLDGASLSLLGSARKEYDTASNGIFDWGASFEGRLNVGNKLNFTLVEGYGKMRIGIFEIRAGRAKEIMGLCDPGLSSGSFSVSGNALGIPKVQISIPEFYSIPWFGKLFAFKGNFAHGWLGSVSMNGWNGDTVQIGTYFHQKSLYIRLGKPSWRLKLVAGLNHQVLWGNEQSYYGDNLTLSPLQIYLYVITAKQYSNDNISNEFFGNHNGSFDLGFEYEFKKIKVLFYRQSFYESDMLFHFANIQDGLNGVSLENKNNSNNIFKWKRFLFELLYTKNQAGEPWSPPTPDPYEPYYNHTIFMQGWSYNGAGLGTPFITPKTMARSELPSNPQEYFINNRVRVFHLGFEGAVQKWDYVLKASLSNNYGTYYTTDEEQTTDIENPGSYGIFGRQDQFSAYIDFNREFNKGLNFGCTAAFDAGELFENSFGVLFSVSKSF
jgi:hypothetical protein